MLFHSPTSTRTLESLCEELAEQGLLKLPRDVKIKDYVGNYAQSISCDDGSPYVLGHCRYMVMQYDCLRISEPALDAKIKVWFVQQKACVYAF